MVAWMRAQTPQTPAIDLSQAPSADALSPRLLAYFGSRPSTPVLALDLDLVEHQYRRLTNALPEVDVHYAVKANPAAPVIIRLAPLGSKFDVASRGGA